jgi:hypothetical protein
MLPLSLKPGAITMINSNSFCTQIKVRTGYLIPSRTGKGDRAGEKGRMKDPGRPGSWYRVYGWKAI